MADSTYSKAQQGDYMLLELTLPAEEERSICVWGQRHKRYLKEYHRVLYYNLLTSGNLNAHLVDIEEQADTLFSRLVKNLAEKEGVTEQLKEENSMLWVQRMNNIRNRAREIVNGEVVFSQAESIQIANGNDISEVSKRLMDKNRAAYKELGK